MKSSTYSKKDSLPSGKVLPTIVFIIIPLCYMIASIITNFSIVPLKTKFYVIGDFVIGLPSVPLTLILLVFAFIPAIYPTPKFFKKGDMKMRL